MSQHSNPGQWGEKQKLFLCAILPTCNNFSILALMVKKLKVPVKRVDLDQLPAKFDPPDRVPELVQRRRPDADAHHVGHDHHDGAADG